MTALQRICDREEHNQGCCKTGRNAYMRAWNARHPGYSTKYAIRKHLRERFGMTLEDRRNLLHEQDGLCVICFEEPAIHLDHDHKTGQVRGMLCQGCNIGLGAFRDDPERLMNALTYLRDAEADVLGLSFVAEGRGA